MSARAQGQVAVARARRAACTRISIRRMRWTQRRTGGNVNASRVVNRRPRTLRTALPPFLFVACLSPPALPHHALSSVGRSFPSPLCPRGAVLPLPFLGIQCPVPYHSPPQPKPRTWSAHENLSRLHNPCTYIFHCIVAVSAVVKAHLIIITNEKLFSLEAQYSSLRGVSLRFARYMRSKNHAYRYIYCRTAFAPRIRSSTSSSCSLDHVALSSDGCNAPTTRSLARSLAKSNRKCRSEGC